MVAVAKFGGSSVSDAQGMRRCSAILKAHPQVKLAIISATFNTTNMLEKVGELSQSSQTTSAKQLFAEKVDIHHRRIGQDLNAGNETMRLLDEFLREGYFLIDAIPEKPELTDQLLSLGERISSLLFIEAMGTHYTPTFLDARSVIKTDNHTAAARVDFQQTRQAGASILPELLAKGDLIITQGFIGSCHASPVSPQTTTLGREGSDYSAAIFAELINANELHIWKDMPGVFIADPKVVTHAQVLPEVTYDQLTKYAELGAKVIFPQTLLPVKRNNIPVHIRSSLSPNLPGTWVRSQLSTAGQTALPLLYARSSTDGQGLIYSLVGHRAHRLFEQIKLNFDTRPVDRCPLSETFFIADESQINQLYDHLAGKPQPSQY